jgi:hypothetical protein
MAKTPANQQVGPYIYHGTDSEALKSIQREGMHTREAVEMTSESEPMKRLWFGKNASVAQKFAGRRVSLRQNVLDRQEQLDRYGKVISDYPPPRDPTPEMMEYILTLHDKPPYARQVVIRMKEAEIPEDCDQDRPWTESYSLGEDESGYNLVILDKCEIPPEKFEVCEIPEAVIQTDLNPDDV